MPIIDDQVQADSPLSQGDILKDVPLFVTGEDGNPVHQPGSLCLVISRPCTAVRSRILSVAVIVQYPDVPKYANDFRKLKKTLTSLRDGISIGKFFLGHLPNHHGRFCADFTQIFSIVIPVDESERQRFIAARRLARLTSDFSKDMHLSLFRSFASLGFDDEEWWTTEDLECLLAQADADIKTLRADKAKHNAKMAFGGAAGKEDDVNPAKDFDAEVQRLIQEMKPLQDELESRNK